MKFKKNEIINPSFIGVYYFCMVFMFLIILCSIISPVDAKVNPNSTLSISKITDNSITWTYNYTVLLTHASLDGVDNPNFDTKSLQFTANELSPNSTHTFCIYSDTGVNCETGTTLSSIISNQEQFFATIVFLIWFLLGSLCCTLGAVGKVPFVGWGGCLFGIIGITTATNNNLIYFILYLVLICAGIFTGFDSD